MLRGFRHKLLLILHLGVLASAAAALALWPQAWPAVLVCAAGTIVTANWLGRLARRYLNASLGRLRRVADDISAGRPVTIAPLKPEQDLYRLNAAINTLAERLSEAARQQEHLQNELRRRERLAFLGELAATVAHEVNNPLDGVQNCARILRRSLAAADHRGPAEGDGARVMQMLDLIDGGLARIELIVRRLLTLARENAIRPQPVRLTRVLDLIDSLHICLEMKELTEVVALGIGSLVKYDFGLLGVLSEGRDLLRTFPFNTTGCLSDLQYQAHGGDSILDRAMDAGSTSVIESLQSEPLYDVEAALFDSRRLSHAVLVPLSSRGRTSAR